MSDDTEITDVLAEVSIRDGGDHNSDEYQLLVGATTDRGHEPDALKDKAVTLRLADGDALIRIALTEAQARRLQGQLALSTGGDPE